MESIAICRIKVKHEGSDPEQMLEISPSVFADPGQVGPHTEFHDIVHLLSQRTAQLPGRPHAVVYYNARHLLTLVSVHRSSLCLIDRESIFKQDLSCGRNHIAYRKVSREGQVISIPRIPNPKPS